MGEGYEEGEENLLGLGGYLLDYRGDRVRRIGLAYGWFEEHFVLSFVGFDGFFGVRKC